ncbi:MAG: hypothetical protein JW976_02515 [Syntrophaceae bacterium]|nr:hypothetical protein [Syntrophaceae bacterium]
MINQPKELPRLLRIHLIQEMRLYYVRVLAAMRHICCSTLYLLTDNLSTSNYLCTAIRNEIINNRDKAKTAPYLAYTELFPRPLGTNLLAGC